MKISTKGIYALEAMVELATYPRKEYISIHKLAQQSDCSIKYLEQLFQQLKKGGLLLSIRGKEGGYQLSKNADLINAKDVIVAVEGELEPSTCLSKPCPKENKCKTKAVWVGLQQTIYDVLENNTLASLAKQYMEEQQ